MSNKTKKRPLSYFEAITLAETLTEDILQPYCKKIDIAGSVRRHQDHVHDIEIVCLPKKGEVFAPGELLPRRQNLVLNFFQKEESRRHGISIAKSGQRYIKAFFGSVQVDVFMPLESQWGRILAIRTGPKDYSIKLARRWKELGYKGVEGKLLPESGEGYKPTFPTEQSFYKFLNWKWISPQKRH